MKYIKLFEDFDTVNEAISSEDLQISKDFDTVEDSKGKMKISFIDETKTSGYMIIEIEKPSTNNFKEVKLIDTNNKTLKAEEGFIVVIQDFPNLIGNHFRIGKNNKPIGSYELVSAEIFKSE